MPVARFARNGNFIGLLMANTILGFAMPMLLILGGLTGLHLSPNAALVTLPASVQTLAGMLAAAPFSLLMGRFGRRIGFAAGGGPGTCRHGAWRVGAGQRQFRSVVPGPFHSWRGAVFVSVFSLCRRRGGQPRVATRCDIADADLWLGGRDWRTAGLHHGQRRPWHPFPWQVPMWRWPLSFWSAWSRSPLSGYQGRQLQVVSRGPNALPLSPCCGAGRCGGQSASRPFHRA
jgi:hypothetical protein